MELEFLVPHQFMEHFWIMWFLTQITEEQMFRGFFLVFPES